MSIKVFVINLDKRRDRLDDISIPFNWQRFSAIPTTPGYIGCLKSHQTVLQKALDLQLNEVLIFEDDVDLCENFEMQFKEIMDKLPSNWDLLYLGGHNKGTIKEYTTGLNIAENVVCMHAYIVNGKFIKTALEALHSKDNNQTKPNDYKCDVLLADYLSKGNCFICSPPLAWQKAGYSDIERNVTDNVHLR